MRCFPPGRSEAHCFPWTLCTLCRLRHLLGFTSVQWFVIASPRELGMGRSICWSLCLLLDGAFQDAAAETCTLKCSIAERRCCCIFNSVFPAKMLSCLMSIVFRHSHCACMNGNGSHVSIGILNRRTCDLGLVLICFSTGVNTSEVLPHPTSQRQDVLPLQFSCVLLGESILQDSKGKTKQQHHASGRSCDGTLVLSVSINNLETSPFISSHRSDNVFLLLGWENCVF